MGLWLRIEPTHIDGRVLDLVLKDFADVVGIQGGSPVGTLDCRAIFINAVRQQSILHLLYRQEVYLKISMNWELVRGDVKGLNWKGIIRSP